METEECTLAHKENVHSINAGLEFGTLKKWTSHDAIMSNNARIDYINRENFLTELDNGVILCHLAQVICDRAKCAIAAGLVKGPAPAVRGKCFEKAMRRSFFSRDNMENFINFCKALGVHENLLFESDDLVLHNQPRNVILCLLEVARLATRYHLEPPALVQLEKEIAEEERNNSADSGLGSLLSWQFQENAHHNDHSLKMRHSNSTSAISSYAHFSTPSSHLGLAAKTNKLPTAIITSTPSGASDGVPSDHTEDEDWSRGSGEDPDMDVDTSSVGGAVGGPGGDATTELDRKVQLAARLMQRNCQCASGKCSKLRVRKVGEGKYNIAGKNVFVRLLKGRHMMVRVGGGWDTLDHFLLRHDPCQVKVVSRDTPDRPANTSKFLHIRAKYRSPPPREPITR
ncbi:hypothetical protein WA026_013885 [Henosepilachna vigintioctopunctata]|uniref:Growth arrest-specific protein 2 n=1 Tax=Henosepilachna vigintioctopunctata TaxID=420089 RepID=A0AAW1U9A3_9CUCU